jgi:hypothetical protein
MQMESRRATISLALIVLICFFLPWIQVSCGGSEERISGVDLARDGHTGLWLIPLLMLAVVLISISRSLNERRGILAVTSLVSGLITVYLMNREQVRVHPSSGLIAVSLTGWFWLGFGSAILLIILSALRVLKRAPP